MNRITIANDGQTVWSVQSISKDSRTCRFAVEELQRYLKQITGADFSVASSNEGSYRFIVGLRNDFSAAEKTVLPESAEGYDGFAISISENPSKILLIGDNERGVVYAVYDFLEKLGCRWFYPTQDPNDQEVVPRITNLQVECACWSMASPVRFRISNASSFFFDFAPEVMKSQLDAAMKARYNGMAWQCDHRFPLQDQYQEMDSLGIVDEVKKRGMLLHGPAHSFPHFMKNEYFEEHPEWFGFREGQRRPQIFGGSQFCWSNAQAREKFIDNAERFVLSSPGLDILCTLGFDGGRCCECPECLKSTPADLVFLLMNELIERLAVSAPYILVETSGGYDPVHEPPKQTKGHPKLRVVWAHWGRHHGMGYDDDRYVWKSNLELWRTSTPGGITLCQYYTDNFATPWISAPYVFVMEGDRRYVLDKGIDAIYMLCWAKGYWWNHSLNHYMAGRCFYDVSSDLYEIVRDYAHHYYGPKAGPLLAEYYEQWARNIDLPYRVKDESTERERTILADQKRNLIDPAVQLVKDDQLYSYRVGKVATLHEAAIRLTLAHRIHDEIVSLREAGQFERAKDLLENAKVYTDELLVYMASVAALDQGLIDRGEVPGFMTMNVKGWLEPEEKLIAEGSTKSDSGPKEELNSMTMLPSQVTQ